MQTIKAHYIVCTTLAIIAEHNGIAYDLYKDNEGATHEALMRIVAPNISDSDTIDAQLSKYHIASIPLTDKGPSFDTYPAIEIDPNNMAYELKRAYNLV